MKFFRNVENNLSQFPAKGFFGRQIRVVGEIFTRFKKFLSELILESKMSDSQIVPMMETTKNHQEYILWVAHIPRSDGSGRRQSKQRYHTRIVIMLALEFLNEWMNYYTRLIFLLLFIYLFIHHFL